MIEGEWSPRFAPVVGRFQEVVSSGRGGSSLAVVRGAEPLVDIWTGIADPVTGRPWTRDTPAIVFSCSKAVLAALVACVVDDGLLDYDTPVADYWPEFAAGGKGAARVRDVLSHRVGLPTVDSDIPPADVLDGTTIASVLAAQSPSWPPGSAHAYHPLTYGWLVSYLLESTTGRRVEYLIRNLIQPRVAEPVWLGFPVELTASRARIGSTVGEHRRDDDADSALERWMSGDVTAIDAPSILAAGIPGAGIVTTSRSLALFAASMVDDEDPLFSLGARDRATTEQAGGPSIAGEPPPWARWGMGFQLDSEWRRLLGRRSFGHDGYGGQLVVADPDTGLGVAFLTTDLRVDGDQRANEIIAAIRAVVETQD